MPNYCSYDMLIKGKKKNIDEFFKWMIAEYHYGDGLSDCYIIDTNGNHIPVAHHIGYRVFSCYHESYDSDNQDREPDEELTASCFGDVAWSCACTMFKGGSSYFSDIEDTDRRKAISLPEACKELALEIELYSRETGMCFAEHYYINSEGEVQLEESTEYSEDYIQDFTSYEEYANSDDISNPVSREIFEYWFNDGNCTIPRCNWLSPREYAFNFQFL